MLEWGPLFPESNSSSVSTDVSFSCVAGFVGGLPVCVWVGRGLGVTTSAANLTAVSMVRIPYTIRVAPTCCLTDRSVRLLSASKMSGWRCLRIEAMSTWFDLFHFWSGDCSHLSCRVYPWSKGRT